MYQNGRGVTKDYKKAVEWYTKAAEQGNAQGQFNLGYMYRNGKGVTKDDKKAVEWYTKSAEQGNAHGQNNLGYMYENGYCPVDIRITNAAARNCARTLSYLLVHNFPHDISTWREVVATEHIIIIKMLYNENKNMEGNI